MRLFFKIFFYACVFLCLVNPVFAQQSTSNPGAYCSGGFSGGGCHLYYANNTSGYLTTLQDVSTSGGNVNISNLNSGCSNNPSSYIYYSCHYLVADPGQTITCTMRSPISQGFAIYIDWNQDNVFQTPAEEVAKTPLIPPLVVNTILSFVIPPGQPNGTYRMRIRCAYSSPGSPIILSPCGTYVDGETEDYNLYVGPIPLSSGIITATVNGSAPICSGQTTSVNVNSTPPTGVTYSWTGPGNFTSNAQTPLLTNASATASGVYSMSVGGTCPVTKTVAISVISIPVYTLTPSNPAVCQGGSVSAAVNFSAGTNTGAYSYTWTSAPNSAPSPNNTFSTNITTQPITSPQALVQYSVTVSPNALFCPVTQTMAITVTNPSQPTLNLPAPFCNNASPFSLSASPGGGTWSAGPSVSSGGFIIPSLTAIGTITANYLISVNNCTISNSGTISISSPNSPTLTSSPPTLCANDPGFNLMNLVPPGITGSWTGQSVSNNTFLSNNLASGVYALTYNVQSAPVGSACPTSSVYSFPVFKPTVPIIPAINPVCNNAPTVTLTASVPGGTWSAQGISATGIQTPSLNLIGTNTLTYAVGQGTCLASVTKTFHVSQFNPSALSVTLPSLCASSSGFNLMSIVQSTTGGAWIGQSVSNNTFLTGTLPSGIYPLTYSTQSTPNASLCPSSTIYSISLYNPPTPVISPIPPTCNNGAAVTLSASIPSGTWTGQGISAAGIQNPPQSLIGTNTLTYSVGQGTCFASSTQTFHVSQFNSAALSSASGTACANDAGFNLMSLVQSTVGGSWLGQYVSNNIFLSGGLPTSVYTLTYSSQSTPIATLCPAFSMYTVSVYHPPMPVISYINPVCTNGAAVSLSASIPGGTWAGNGISASGIQNPAQNLIGTNTLTYSVGQGTCLASAIQNFQVSQFNSAALISGTLNACATQGPVNLMNQAQNSANGTWSGPSVTGGSIFQPPASLSGTYAVIYSTFSTPDPLLCPDKSTLIVSVLNPPQPVISPVSPLCNKNSALQLSVTPAGGVWTSNSYLDAHGILTPSLCSTGNNLVEYVIGTATCNSKQSIFINVESFVSAQITSTIQDQCNTNSPISLIPYTQSNTGYWSGPGLTGSNFNPGSVGSGNFTLSYHTSSFPSGLCPDVGSMAVKVFSLAPPSITKAGPFCEMHLPTQLLVNPVGGLFGGSIPGIISSGGLFNPALALAGDNFVTYSISVGPCKAYAQEKISVEKFVSASLAKMPDAFYCNNHVPFNLNSFVQNTGGTWTGGTGLIGLNMFDPSQAEEGNNRMIYRTSSSPSGLCTDADTVFIQVKNTPPVQATSSSFGNCAPLEVILNTSNTNKGTGNWNITDGSHYEGLAANHIFTSPGSYTVMLSYTDNEAKGCTTQVVLPPILIYESPKADFSVSDEITISDPVAILNNESTVLNNNKYMWTIQGQDPVYGVSPSVKFAEPGNYKITLTATSFEGCKNEITKTVEIKNEFNVFVPNSFTPNFDGTNDVFIPVFTVYGLDAKSFEMEIFDRWGHSVCHTNDLAKGWDGTVQSETAKEDVYVYMIRYKDLNGKLYNKTGQVNLIR